MIMAGGFLKKHILWIRLESVTPFSALCRINQKKTFPSKKMLEDIQWTRKQP